MERGKIGVDLASHRAPTLARTMSQWACPACTFLNEDASRGSCEICLGPLPALATPAAAEAQRKRTVVDLVSDDDDDNQRRVRPNTASQPAAVANGRER